MSSFHCRHDRGGGSTSPDDGRKREEETNPFSNAAAQKTMKNPFSNAAAQKKKKNPFSNAGAKRTKTDTIYEDLPSIGRQTSFKLGQDQDIDRAKRIMFVLFDMLKNVVHSVDNMNMNIQLSLGCNQVTEEPKRIIFMDAGFETDIQVMECATDIKITTINKKTNAEHKKTVTNPASNNIVDVVIHRKRMFHEEDKGKGQQSATSSSKSKGGREIQVAWSNNRLLENSKTMLKEMENPVFDTFKILGQGAFGKTFRMMIRLEHSNNKTEVYNCTPTSTIEGHDPHGTSMHLFTLNKDEVKMRTEPYDLKPGSTVIVIIGVEEHCWVKKNNEYRLFERPELINGKEGIIVRKVDQNTYCVRLLEKNNVEWQFERSNLRTTTHEPAENTSDTRYAICAFKYSTGVTEKECSILNELRPYAYSHHLPMLLNSVSKTELNDSEIHRGIMTDCADMDLSHYIYKDVPDIKLLERFSMEIFEAIKRIHELGIVHRDVKIANILLMWRNGNYVAVLSDFGLASKLRLLSDRRLLVGSAPYISPELLICSSPDGEDPTEDILKSADWYAYCITIARMFFPKFNSDITKENLHSIYKKANVHVESHFWKDQNCGGILFAMQRFVNYITTLTERSISSLKADTNNDEASTKQYSTDITSVVADGPKRVEETKTNPIYRDHKQKTGIINVNIIGREENLIFYSNKNIPPPYEDWLKQKMYCIALATAPAAELTTPTEPTTPTELASDPTTPATEPTTTMTQETHFIMDIPQIKKKKSLSFADLAEDMKELAKKTFISSAEYVLTIMEQLLLANLEHSSLPQLHVQLRRSTRTNQLKSRTRSQSHTRGRSQSHTRGRSQSPTRARSQSPTRGRSQSPTRGKSGRQTRARSSSKSMNQKSS